MVLDWAESIAWLMHDPATSPYQDSLKHQLEHVCKFAYDYGGRWDETVGKLVAELDVTGPYASLIVGRFYFRQKQYVAAANQANIALRQVDLSGQRGTVWGDLRCIAIRIRLPGEQCRRYPARIHCGRDPVS